LSFPAPCNRQSFNKNLKIQKYKNIKIDTSSAKVYKDNEEIIFTSLEYRILFMLFSNQNKLITREQLLEKIWDVAGNFVNDNTLTVYIKRIREKRTYCGGNRTLGCGSALLGSVAL